jgi:DNA-binding transcriptional LysR family regulator
MNKHVGRHAHRLAREPREAAFAEEWAQQNTLVPLRASTLAYLLSDDDHFVPEPTQAQATDAATVIQWLGSPVGWSFLENAVKRAGYRLVEIPGGGE